MIFYSGIPGHKWPGYKAVPDSSGFNTHSAPHCYAISLYENLSSDTGGFVILESNLHYREEGPCLLSYLRSNRGMIVPCA
jgi:hypothetical protein